MVLVSDLMGGHRGGGGRGGPGGKGGVDDEGGKAEAGGDGEDPEDAADVAAGTGDVTEPVNRGRLEEGLQVPHLQAQGLSLKAVLWNKALGLN